MERDFASVYARLVGWTNAVAAVAASAFVAGHSLAFDLLGEDALARARAPAVAVLCLNLVRLLWKRPPRDEPAHLLSLGPEGEVLVSREALVSALRAAAERVPGVARAGVKVRRSGPRRTVVRTGFQALEGSPVPELAGALREAVRSSFRSLVSPPPDMRVEFEVELEGFAPGPGPRKDGPAEPAAKAREETPFTGPRYPIDDGEDD